MTKNDFNIEEKDFIFLKMRNLIPVMGFSKTFFNKKIFQDFFRFKISKSKDFKKREKIF